MSICPKTQKIIHADAKAARAAIRSLYKAGRGNPDYMPYPCGSHWHIGHSRGRLAKRIRRALRRQP